MNNQPEQLTQFEPSVIYECGDVITSLEKFSNTKFDLIITSPPYNIGKEYEKRKSIEEYLSEQEEIIDKLIYLLDDWGSICWEVGNFVDEKTKEIFPLA